jgi:membrane-associated phospholipid phosphatase
VSSFWLYAVVLLLLVWSTLYAGWLISRRRGWIGAVDGRRGPPAQVGLALAFSALSSGAVIVALLASAWRDSPLAVDVHAQALARQAWSPATGAVMGAVTWLGDPLVLAAIGAVVGFGLLLARQPVLLVSWLFALLGNSWLNPALKGLYARIRPIAEFEAGAFTGYSFPSGHTSGAMVCYGMLAYLCWRLAPERLILPAMWAAASVVIAVGASRIFLHAHYVSDVIAGCASGAAWLALTIAAGRVVAKAWHN